MAARRMAQWRGVKHLGVTVGKSIGGSKAAGKMAKPSSCWRKS